SSEYGIPGFTDLLIQATYYHFIVENDKTYYWAVQTVDTGYRESPSFSAERAIDTLFPPSPISNLTALAGSKDGEVKLKWTAPGDDGTNGTCTGYLVKYATYQITSSLFNGASTFYNNWQPLESLSPELQAVTGLIPGTTYFFAVKGFDGSSYGLWNSSLQYAGINSLNFAPAQDLVPSSPTWTTQEIADEYLILQWNKNPEIDIDSYYLEKATSSAGAFQQILSTSSAFTSYTLTGLVNFTTHYFRMRAIDWRDAIGPYSSVTGLVPADYAEPAAVSTLSALQSVSAGQIYLNWTAPGDNGWQDTVTGGRYEIAAATYSFDSSTSSFLAAPFQVSLSTDITPLSFTLYTVTGLTGDSTFYLRIRAVDEVSNKGSPSNIVFAKTLDAEPPAAITSLSALTGDNSGEIILNWTAPGDNGSSGYVNGGRWRIDYSTYSLSWDTNTYKADISTSFAPGSSQTRTLTGLIAGATYFMRIWTADEVPNWSPLSIGATAHAMPDIFAPDSFILSVLNSRSYSSLAQIEGTAEDDYGLVTKVEINIGGNWFLADGTTSWSLDVSTFSFTSGQYHTLLVKSEDSYGNFTTLFAVQNSSVTFFFDDQPPGAVTDLNASTGTLTGTIMLRWTAPADEPAKGAASAYILKFASYTLADTTSWWDRAGLWDTGLAPASPGVQESETVTGLTPSVTYWFIIRSADGTDFYPSTSTFSNYAFERARFGPDVATFFTVSVTTTSIQKGAPLNFTVTAENPHGIATQYVRTVSLSAQSASFWPADASYVFALSDAGIRTFPSGVIFNQSGTGMITAAENSNPSVTGVSPPIAVSGNLMQSVNTSGSALTIIDGNPADGNSSVTFANGSLSPARNITLTLNPPGVSSLNGNTPGLALFIEPENLFFNNPVQVKMLYNDRDSDGTVDEIPLAAASVDLFWWDGVNWRRLDTSLDSSNHLLTALIYHSGLVAFFPSGGEFRSFENVKEKRKIFTPNGDGLNDNIEFVGLTAPFTVSIFSVSGEKVRELTDLPRWDGKGENGKTAESGIYIYTIEKSGEKTTGVIVVAK
ncbi:MAG TPA: gliding motility-associated C-terminal domain-containing protein, partial [bacterium]|nr:gliding motility-associated C-terminal domain-containing protein [bacterium]